MFACIAAIFTGAMMGVSVASAIKLFDSPMFYVNCACAGAMFACVFINIKNLHR